MGIDLLDLTFRMEKQFRLKMDMTFWGDILVSVQQSSPQVSVKDLTVGQVQRELVHRLKNGGRYVETSYLAEKNLKEVQSKLSERFSTRAVAPGTKLQELFGHQLWREDWYELGDMFGIEMPQIGWSHWTPYAFGLGLVASVLWIAFAQMQEQSIEVAVLIDIAVITALIVWCMGRSQRLPFQNWTVGQLAHHVLLDRTSQDGDTKWSEELVWIAITEILCDTLRVESDAVTPDAKLVRDLGAS